SLLAPVEQRALLDRAAGKPALDARARLGDARAEVKNIETELATLGGDERARAREIDLLRYQLTEIGDAAVAGADHDDLLAAEEAVLADAEAHRDALGAAYDALSGPATDALGDATGAIAGRAPFAALADRLHALQEDTAEAARDVRLVLEQVVVDPER